MAPSIKMGLLSLVSVAAAVPHSGAGGHSKFHSSKATGAGGYGTGSAAASPPPYPTSGWSGQHNHTHIGHTASGAHSKSPTTTIIDTIHSTETVVSTVYATRPGGGNGGPNSVGAQGASSGGGEGGAGGCGPATVYVTATNKVTVTVPAGGAPGSTAIYATSAAGSAPPVGPASSKKPHSSKVHSSKGEQPTPSNGGGYVSSAAAQGAPSSLPFSAPGYSMPSFSTPPVVSPSMPAPSQPAVSSHAAPSYSKPASSAVPSKPASSAVPSKPSSSAAQPSASSSPGGGYSGGKRGLSWDWNDAPLLTKFSGGKFGFGYNWNTKKNGDLPSGVQYIPTLNPINEAEKWAAGVEEAYKSGSRVLFTFNEPDQPGQASMPPATACQTWDTYVAPLIQKYPDMTVVAPSVTNGGGDMGLTYLENFKKACPQAEKAWSHINIHFYDLWNNGGAVKTFTDHYELAKKQNPGKKVWVSEVNLRDGSTDDATAAKFLQAVIDYLEKDSDCVGYSWWAVGTKAQQLVDASGNLNQCGKAYVS